ncbi:MAG TPA: histone deacetylase family protein [Archaeoglobaceae archaeon]|nr:histone deacetylase family protein [Archaeoglobaceae archaeon]
MEDILLVHSKWHHDDIKDMHKIYEIASLSAGGAIKAAKISLDKPAFALIRPPGHHASPEHCWGFCYFNNIAIAVRRLMKDKIIERAVIVDFDLHFGDGTDNVFKEDENVEYFHMKNRDIEGISDFLSKIDYDIIAVSAGFDRHKDDWGGILEIEDYREIGRIVKERSEEKCYGRRFAVLEGGYNHAVLGKNVRAFIKGME